MKTGRCAKAVQQSWYGDRPIRALLPLSWIYAAIVTARRWAYHRGWLTVSQLDRPVLVVGNVSVGGSGKTPLTLAVVERARKLGIRPGVVSRGYGGKSTRYPLLVTADTAAAEAGDEPVLMARRAHVPVVVDPDRVRAGRYLIESEQVTLIIADDGLQHYRLGRDAEIAVVDARRRYGNGRLLPAGPLREPLSRERNVDMVCVHGREHDFWLAPGPAHNIRSGEKRALSSFGRVHAFAGIGEPGRFFGMLRNLGLDVIEHGLPDHHEYDETELDFDDGLPILMTEKDGVKCVDFASDRLWMVPVETVLSAGCTARLDALLQRLVHPQEESGR